MLALQLEAAAEASSIQDLFERLSAKGQFLRVDQTIAPTMYRGPTLSEDEVELLRRITGVVRLGKVRRIERGSIVLEHGTIPTSADALHVHCATVGLNPAPEVPIFSDEQIVLQSIRIGLIPFNAALIGYVEATREDTVEKNRLCPPNRQPNTPADWARGLMVSMGADRLWSKQPDISEWLDRARLNPTRGLRQRAHEPQVRSNLARYAQLARPALSNLASLVSHG